ncbi:hypothetical protein [Streptomyces sp. NBC_01476]|nr:hypothetical protein [Streptomyces sp. NBC_01476]
MPGSAAARLKEAGVAFSARGGNLRFAVHLYTTAADIDLALDALA